LARRALAVEAAKRHMQLSRGRRQFQGEGSLKRRLVLLPGGNETAGRMPWGKAESPPAGCLGPESS
jgi:hypothetical protein